MSLPLDKGPILCYICYDKFKTMVQEEVVAEGNKFRVK
jgi:hypothetical protein